MKLPIAYALSYPKRLAGAAEGPDLFKIGSFHFEKPDLSVFRCLALAYRAIAAGGSYTAALNAANEEAVAAFLSDRISFVQIEDCVEYALEKHSSIKLSSIEDIEYAEMRTRDDAREFITRMQLL